MKKIIFTTIIGMLILSSTGMAFADNAVSRMATNKGGQHVAECAQKMDRGISECARMLECNK